MEATLHSSCLQNLSMLDWQLPHLLSRGQLETFVHATCGRCHHWHDGMFKTLPNSPDIHVDVKCERCGLNMFGLGRRSTHLSHLSQESKVSWNEDSGIRQSPWACTNRRPLSRTSSQVSPRTSKPNPPQPTSPDRPAPQPVMESQPRLGSTEQREAEQSVQVRRAEPSHPGEDRKFKQGISRIFRLPQRKGTNVRKRRKLLENSYRKLGEKLLDAEVRIFPRSRPPAETLQSTIKIADGATERRISGTVGEGPTHYDAYRSERTNGSQEAVNTPTLSPHLRTVNEAPQDNEEQRPEPEYETFLHDKKPEDRHAVLPKRHPLSSRTTSISRLRQRYTHRALQKNICECTSSCHCLQHQHPRRPWGFEDTSSGSMDPQVPCSTAHTVTSSSIPKGETDSQYRTNSAGVFYTPVPSPRGSRLQRHVRGIGTGAMSGFSSHYDHRDSGMSLESAWSRYGPGSGRESGEGTSASRGTAPMTATATAAGYRSIGDVHIPASATGSAALRRRSRLATSEVLSSFDAAESSQSQRQSLGWRENSETITPSTPMPGLGLIVSAPTPAASTSGQAESRRTQDRIVFSTHPARSVQQQPSRSETRSTSSTQPTSTGAASTDSAPPASQDCLPELTEGSSQSDGI